MSRTPARILRCARCQRTFKASKIQAEAHGAGRKVHCTRECQKGNSHVTVPCVTCGKELQRRVCDLAESGRAFCDATCRGQASKPKTGREIPCAVCETPIWVIPALEGKKKTCSRECKLALARVGQVTRLCDYCGAEYTRSASREGRFCSKKCSDDQATADGQGYVNDDGYVVKSFKGRPRLLHRINAEAVLGRPLRSDEDVHHRDTNKLNNEADGPFVLNERGNLVSGNLEVWAYSHPRGGEIGPQIEWAVDTLTTYADVLPADVIDHLTHLVGRLTGQEKPAVR